MADDEPWIASSAHVIGDASLGAGSSVWFGAVIRADEASITIGARSNVQDNAVLHADPGFPLHLDEDVSIGHSAVCHGCTIRPGVLIGMGAIVMNGAVVGAGSTVAAGAVVPAGMQVPAGSLVAGVPAKVLRSMTPEEILANRANATTYVQLAAAHRAGRFHHRPGTAPLLPTDVAPEVFGSRRTEVVAHGVRGDS